MSLTNEKNFLFAPVSGIRKFFSFRYVVDKFMDS